MNFGRLNFGCGIFQSTQHQGRPILVVSPGGDIFSSEFLDLTLPGSEWVLSSQDISGQQDYYYAGSLSPTSDGKGLLFTRKYEVFSFFCENKKKCYWIREDYSLQISRRRHLMMNVPSHLVKNCN